MSNTDFDVIVVGGGHAGCEAAFACSRMGFETALVTLSEKTIGALSCNPAIGGVGKGQLTREIDALGGVQGFITDKAGLHYRMLNTSKGEAVRSLRAQVDKDMYSRCIPHPTAPHRTTRNANASKPITENDTTRKLRPLNMYKQ